MNFDTIIAFMIDEDQDEAEFSKILLLEDAIDLSDDEGITLLMWAVRFGQSTMVDLLLRLGANVNAHSRPGLTAAMIAVIMARLDLLRKLVDHGASLDQRDIDGLTTMDYARIWDRTDIIKYLEHKLERAPQ
jgi:ankyrin repeat protein